MCAAIVVFVMKISYMLSSRLLLLRAEKAESVAVAFVRALTSAPPTQLLSYRFYTSFLAKLRRLCQLIWVPLLWQIC